MPTLVLLGGGRFRCCPCPPAKPPALGARCRSGARLAGDGGPGCGPARPCPGARAIAFCSGPLSFPWWWAKGNGKRLPFHHLGKWEGAKGKTKAPGVTAWGLDIVV